MEVSSAKFTRLEDKLTIENRSKDAKFPKTSIHRYNYAMHCFMVTHSHNDNMPQYKGKFLWIKTTEYDKPTDTVHYNTLSGTIFRWSDCCTSLFLLVALIVTSCMLLITFRLESTYLTKQTIKNSFNQ